MPKRKDIKKVVIFGSGPIVIGQACEFDYSGTQACKALMAEGLEVVLINSNPATIMTDPEIATRVYVEPLRPKFIEQILEKEKPDAVIPTLGGQTALNLALKLEADGVFERLGIELLGADSKVIRRAEDREEFCEVLDSVGALYPKSRMIRSYEEGMELAEEWGVPLVLRPNFTLGGAGGGIAFSLEEYQSRLAAALHESPTHEVLVEESILGWKEFELEVMRDASGTFVVICSIENFDPCGVHTGDSITVAPQQTLSDKEYQAMRDEAQKIIEKVGVTTGGANIQFATHPETGKRYVIEMNPRVSRSSALASKATGFPIAKIAALLAIGYRLDEIQNDITGTTPSCYEPALDYVVTKIPRFAFEKFAGSKDSLTTQMKSVGEVMGIGRNFKESFQKAVLSLEADPVGLAPVDYDEELMAQPNSKRLWHLVQAMRENVSLERIGELTGITPWFLEQVKDIVDEESNISKECLSNADELQKLKRFGFSDTAIASQIGMTAEEVRAARWDMKLHPCYYQVDTCAGEFASETPYFYSTYWGPASSGLESSKPKVMIFGSGPNRIGQGIEFDYSCVRAVKRFQAEDHFVVMVNSNPETVSTDYDTSDALFFEPLVDEHVREILRHVEPEGVLTQVGGQTPIGLAPNIVKAGYRLLGSDLSAIHLAEDRGEFAKVCRELEFKIPKSGMASDISQAKKIVGDIGYPILCRPSYVLGGRRMEIIETESELESYFERNADAIGEAAPCLIDEFLSGALEADVDLVRGDDWTVIGGIVEHIEAAGVHSGDSMGVLPPQRLKRETADKIEEMSKLLADRLNIIGFLNLQLAIRDDEIYMIEANPRSSRSLPFMVKATDLPLVDLGVLAVMGRKASDIKLDQYNWRDTDVVSVKGVVFPFKKFSEADTILGPEMKSTGETMGRAHDYAEALLKATLQSQLSIPHDGQVFLSLREKDKPELEKLIRELHELGFSLCATGGTAKFIESLNIPVETVLKVHEGRPNCVDRIRSGQVDLVINTTSGRRAIEASFGIRRSCIDYSIPCLTESDAAKAFMIALKRLRNKNFEVSHLPAPREV